LGATGLESDAWITADGQVVLHHDGRTGPFWRRRPVSGQRRAQLPGQVPTLAELYQRCGREFELSLDIKDRDALPAVLAQARAAGAITRLWLCHGDWRWLAGWRARIPDARLVHSTRLAHIEEGLAARAAGLRDAGIDVLNLPGSDWTAARVATIHAARLRAFAWDARSGRRILGLVRLGVDGLYSDHVKVLMAAIAAEAAQRRG
jgi:glycerophosphoryl diester phosphodiesterase